MLIIMAIFAHYHSHQQSTAKIQHARVTAAVSPVSASARPVGKATIVEHATSRCTNACPVAPTTATTTSKLARASAIATGLDTIARRLFAVWIVARTESASLDDVAATSAGMDRCASN
jgi:hypothetical protein